MRFVDWFAGIGGFRLGLERAGHTCVFSCEIHPFARKVYAARFGAPPEAEDVTRVEVSEIPEADLWCAGFPCQDVSAAGLRTGLVGRSGLVWKLLDLASVARPSWILLENVPGLFAFRDGFGRLLARLDDLGYVGAWRVLDAQFFGVPQRRRRVFILAGRAGTCRPEEVLLEPSRVRGRSSSRRAPGPRAPEGSARGAGGGIARNLTPHPGGRNEPGSETFLFGEDVADTVQAHHGRGAPDDLLTRGVASTIEASKHGRGSPRGSPTDNLVSFSFSPESGQASDLCARATDTAPTLTCADPARTDRGIRVIGFDLAQVTHHENRSRCAPDEAAPSLAKTGQAHVAFVVPSAGANEKAHESPVARTLDSNGGYGHAAGGTLDVVPSGVRRLTPRECERLQGLPDDWTLVDGAADSPRYEAIGNGVAIPVIRWIGERLPK